MSMQQFIRNHFYEYHIPCPGRTTKTMPGSPRGYPALMLYEKKYQIHINSVC